VGEVKVTLLGRWWGGGRGWRKSAISLEGSKASPARPSDKSRVEAKTLERVKPGFPRVAVP
jgi:hypothetical protein